MADESNLPEDYPPPGTVVAGKYRVERLLGRGGMGAVVAATHLGLDQQVAVKFLLGKAVSSRAATERFEREAKIAARLSTEHVVRVTDTGVLDDGTPFMVMEHLRGHDLAELAEGGGLPIGQAVDYILEACVGLGEAHMHGIVHRDLKPANLFLAERADGPPIVKVLDFGISKLLGTQLTATSSLMGSPLYMSPEQLISAKHVDHRSDIWALGSILFELIAGTPAFAGDTLPQVCTHIMQSPPRDLRQAVPGAPDGLQAVIERCLTKNVDARFADIGELAVALAPFGTEASGRSLDRIRAILSRHGRVMAETTPGAPAAMETAATMAPLSVASPGPPVGHTVQQSPVAQSPVVARAAVSPTVGGITEPGQAGPPLTSGPSSEVTTSLVSSSVEATPAPPAGRRGLIAVAAAAVLVAVGAVVMLAGGGDAPVGSAAMEAAPAAPSSSGLASSAVPAATTSASAEAESELAPVAPTATAIARPPTGGWPSTSPRLVPTSEPPPPVTTTKAPPPSTPPPPRSPDDLFNDRK